MKAVVLHSGGMDSSTCLKLAMDEYGVDNIIAVSFAYGQRHASELEAAAAICEAWAVSHRTFDLPILQQITRNALIDATTTIEQSDHQPANTLVVGRNGLLARLGAIYADHVGADSLWLGVMGRPDANSGYRDCSREYMDLQQQILRIDLDKPSFEIRTPLVAMTKEESIALADQLGILNFLLEKTVTCYEGIPGSGCGLCPSCRLRREGLDNFLKNKHLIVGKNSQHPLDSGRFHNPD